MVYETFYVIITLLLVVICFLLYKLYMIKYNGRSDSTEFIPENWKKELMNLDGDSGREMEMRFGDLNSSISELEKRIERNEGFVEKLVKELLK